MQRIALKCGRFYRSIPRCVNISLNNYNKSIPRLQYVTTNTTVHSNSNSLSDNTDDKPKTNPTRNGYETTTDYSSISSVKSVKYFCDENIIQITFTDLKTINFNTLWLRDSCYCHQCVHPINKSKLINSPDVCANHLTVQQITCFDHFIEICWRDKESNKEHKSQYPNNWLKLFVHIFGDYSQNELNFVAKYPNDGLYAPKTVAPERVLWHSNQINQQKLTTKYSDFMNCDQSLKQCLQSFNRFGIAFLEDVPIDGKAVLSVARRITGDRCNGLAYDLNKQNGSEVSYKKWSPGVQLVHCLKGESVGDPSTLVDAIKCAEVFRQTNNQLFHLLTKYEVLFAFWDTNSHLWYRQKWPIIELNNDNSVKQIHYTSSAMRPPIAPFHTLDMFYEAYRKLTQLLRDDKYVFEYYLRTGDLIIVNNRRILHGRDGMDNLTHNRHLTTCYLDLDELKALYEKLIETYGTINLQTL